MESEEQCKQTHIPTQTHRRREQTGGCRRGGVGNWVRRPGLRSADWRAHTGCGDVEAVGNAAVGNAVHSTAVTMQDAGWVPEISGGTLCRVYGCLITMLCTWN